MSNCCNERGDGTKERKPIAFREADQGEIGKGSAHVVAHSSNRIATVMRMERLERFPIRGKKSKEDND